MYVLMDTNPLILALMRTLHTSLDFVSLPSKDRVMNEMESLVGFLVQNHIINETFFPVVKEKADELYLCILSLFHKTEYRHSDGMTTRLFISMVRGEAFLCASFTPNQKPYSVVLAPVSIPYNNLAASQKDFTPLPDAALIRGKDNRLILA